MFEVYAEIVKDSQVEETGERLTTVEVHAPVVVIPELLLFGLSASLETLKPAQAKARVEQSPFVPPKTRADSDHWLSLMDEALIQLDDIDERDWITLLQPWLWQKVLLTGQNYRPFFDAARRADATDNFKEVRHVVRELVENHIPLKLAAGQWHLPYIDFDLKQELTPTQALQTAAVRCSLADTEDQVRMLSRLSHKPAGVWPSADHVALAVGYAHPGLYPGWQAYSHFLRHNLTPPLRVL